MSCYPPFSAVEPKIIHSVLPELLVMNSTLGALAFVSIHFYALRKVTLTPVTFVSL